MVEMGGNQGSVGTANQQVQNQHSVPDTTLNLDPETIFCLDNDHWLTIDISTLEQDVNSLYNSVFGSNGTETNNSETGTGNGNIDEQRCASPVSSRGKKINSAEVPQTVESDIWGLDLDDQVCQNRGTEGNLDLYYEARSPLSFWGAPMDLDMLKMDDVFQVDKAELVQGPTLAELNANDESLFNSLDYYDTLLPEGRKLSKQLTQSSKCNNNNASMPITIKHKATNNATSIHPTTPPIGTSAAIPINAQNNYQSVNKPLSSSIPATSQPLQCASLLQKNHSSMPKTHTISSAKKTFDSDMIKLHNVSQNDSVEQSSVIPQLSSSAPATTGFLQDWKETPVHQKKLPTIVGHQRTRRDTDHSIHSFSSMSSLSNDEDANSEREDEENNGDCISTDNESLPGEELSKKSPSWTLSYGNSLTKSKKKKRFFWQYNIQSKGPKGPRVCLSSESLDPHVLSSATDPVFSSYCQLDGVKHAGKARRGDGNDLTPNPKKLYNIGAELKKLSKIINDLTPVSELPFNSRSKSRKEKNKLASRACRLKKKAQHEANKLKLYGLQQEHKLLLKLLDDLKEIIKGKIDPESFSCNQVVPDDLDSYIKKADPEMVAGQASEFVNKVLDKVAFGDPNGGLTQL